MAAPVSMPALALRGGGGIWLFDGPPALAENKQFNRNESPACKVMAFSNNGSHFAMSDGESVKVYDTRDYQRAVTEIDKRRTVGLQFSPCGTMLVTWEPYMVTKEQAAGTPNLHIWEVGSGRLVKALMQKKVSGWCPQWTADEAICGRNVNNEIHFFENNNFDNIVNKLHLQKIADFKIPERAAEPNHRHVAAYVPGSKGQPSFVRVYQYPNFGGPQSALANKSFYKAEKVDMLWNKKGTALLVLASTDQSLESYYGDQGLHYVDVRGESCLVPRGKNGPVYHVAWSPSSTEFCVVYGFMPAKATLFNLKCDPVFDFGTGPRNVCHFNPQGNILCLAGFGNLRGNMEFWSVKDKQLVSNPQAADSTHFEWSPDGQHFATATLSPRLRVGNGYKFWDYTGRELYSTQIPEGGELWEVLWQPVPEGHFPEFTVSSPSQQSGQAAPQVGGVKKEAYVPPGLRNRIQPTVIPKYREEYEPASNVKEQQAAASAEPMSKAALKNKKKREAKAKQKKDESAQGGVRPGPPQPAVSRPVQPASQPPPGLNPETDKKARNIRKKLQAIDKLKAQQASGLELETNQMEKIKTEASLIAELEALGL